MKEREATDDEKNWIRDEIESAVAKEASQEALAEIRSAISDLTGLSIAQVCSIGAWKRMPAGNGLILEKTPVGEDHSEQPAVEKEVSTNYTLPCSDEGSDSYQFNGEDFNYDNPEKNEWRKKWKNFLEKNSSKQERERMKILCLPGKECLEIPLYLELGFLPENIVGVEGGRPETRAEFVKNATKFGIRPVEGKLEKVIPRDSERYDVVSLDFVGPMCEAYQKILSQFLLKDKAIVLLNTMGKREGRKSKKLIQFGHGITEVQHNSYESFEKLMRRTMNIDEEGDGLQASLGAALLKLCDEDFEIPEESGVRSKALRIGLSMIGADRQENLSYLNLNASSFPELQEFGKASNSSPDPVMQFFSGMNELLEALAQTMEFHGVESSRSHSLIFRWLICKSLQKTPSMKCAEYNEYFSQASSDTSRSPFNSIFAILGGNFKGQASQGAWLAQNFALACMNARLKSKLQRKNTSFKFVFKDKDFMLPERLRTSSKRTHLRSSDNLMYSEDRKTVASIKFGTFLKSSNAAIGGALSKSHIESLKFPEKGTLERMVIDRAAALQGKDAEVLYYEIMNKLKVTAK